MSRTLATIYNPPTRDYFEFPRIDPFQSRALQSSTPKQPAAASPYKLPPLEFQQQQASQQYWPGATSSTTATSAQALNTLPTPPSDGNDGGYKSQGQNTKVEYNSLGAAAVQQPGMAPNLETAGVSTSLTARRPAATNLPPFDLPPVPFNQQYTQKYAPLPAINATTQQNTSSVSVGNLLTPPTTLPGDVLSPISALNGVTGTQNYSNFAWPPLNMNTGLTPYGVGTGTTPQPWNNPARGMFSPSIAGTLAQRGTSNSPSAGDSIPPPPPYDVSSLPPIPSTTMSMSMSMSTPSTLAPPTAQQQALAHAYMAQGQTQTQTPVSATTTQASPISGTDAYSQRPQSTPSSFYSHSQPSSAQQSSFPGFNNSSPVQHSPMSAPPQMSRISPIHQQSAVFSPPTSQAAQFGRSSYSPYSLPAMSTAPVQMSGPIMSNIHSPNNPMGMIGMPSNSLPGGMFHSGVSAHLNQQMYGSQQQPAHNERPFKCDQCPQSFNRNHDLKRHKRIHLAVKPFPCGHCEKSFSRKDALKASAQCV